MSSVIRYISFKIANLAHDASLEHCLHMLKEAVTCQGDTTILTMKWGPRGPLPIGDLSNPHECVNWERLMEWVEPHAFDAFADGVLMHPEFGKHTYHFSFCADTNGDENKR